MKLNVRTGEYETRKASQAGSGLVKCTFDEG